MGSKGRELDFQAVHYLRKAFTFSAGDAGVVTIGTLPAGALVVGGGVYVGTAFNAGTANTADIGTAADPDGFATALSLTAAGYKVLDDLATSNDLLTTADTDVIATLALTGTAASAGSGIAVIEFVVNNDK